MPGTANETELGEDNGYAVYEIEVSGEDGKLHEVKVNAGSGEVLLQETDDEGSERGGAGEADEITEVSPAEEPAGTTAG